MDVKESTIDSEIYRHLANIIKTGFEHDGVKYNKVEFHYRVGSGEADIVVFGEKGGKPLTLVIEAKGRDAKKTKTLDPYSVGVIGQALGYAKVLGAQFVATTNGDMLLLFDAFMNKPLLETQIGAGYKVKYDAEFFKRFLRDLAAYTNGTLALLPLGDAFVGRLKYFHEILIPSAYSSLKEKLKTNAKFETDYRAWVEEQGFKFVNDTHENIAKQFAYLIMNRVLFYKTLETRKPELHLPELKSQEEEKFEPKDFPTKLRKYFDKVVNDVDYEAVFEYAQILDDISITLPLAEYLNDFIRDLEHYNLSGIRRDVIGHVYEQMIPADERKRLGQYYTPPLICDLIATLCINSPEAKILDPSCGSGGFLLSSYSRLLNLMNKKESDGKSHNYILNHIYGIDINQFAAHLSVVNLSIRNLDANTDIVNVMASDFFKVSANQATLTPHKKLSLKGYAEVYHALPANFDVVITNPPYTRQDDIGNKKYVDFIRNIALSFDGKEMKLSSEAGIYTYFFTHGFHFLKEGGLLGYIVSNSWMDVKFGKELQKFFLDNFKIKSIIDFDKRSFQEAAVNTVIVILQKLTGKNSKLERDSNKVKFVRVKGHLSVKQITNIVDKTTNSYEDENVRCILISQHELYKDSKWGKYLKAPEVYYKLMENKKITELQKLATVSAGTVTLANDFFILQKDQAKKMGIEQRYLKPAITKAKTIKFLDARNSDTDAYILTVNDTIKELSDTNVLKYVRYGEQKDITLTRGSEKGKVIRGYHNTPALATKKIWYSLGEIKAEPILVPVLVYDRWYAVWNKENIHVNDTFYWVKPLEENNTMALLGVLNSTLIEFFVEIYGKAVYGEGVIQLRKHIFDELPVPNINLFSKRTKENVGNLFEKLCDARRNHDEKAESKIKEELDDIIFDALSIKDLKREVVISLDNMKATRKSKTEAKVLIDGREAE